MHPGNGHLTPLGLNADFVLTRCDFFVDVQLWPLQTKIDARGWLENFTADELAYAFPLLNGFLYFSRPLIDQLFISAFQSLSRRFLATGQAFLAVQSKWRTFVNSLLVTYVTGESPNVTDSGYTFARKARDLLRIDESRILSPEATLRELYFAGPQPVLFVDDFVGSGDQFIKTWRRSSSITPTLSLSFERHASVRGGQFFYCPTVCTEYGLGNVLRDCPGVVVSAAHVLPETYSALSSESVIWPPALRPRALDFLHAASRRAGIPDEDWRGHHHLGLALAFEHGIPDASLPLLFWRENGWRPLFRSN